VIFRRENRGESFQRQINDLRQQQSEEHAEGDEPTYDYEPDEPASTSRFSADQGTPGEGISFPASQPEPAEPVRDEPPPAAATSYQEQSRWQPAQDATTSIIAANSHWNGTLRCDSPLRVHGKADGELHSTSDLYVAEGAEVDAELHAESVVVAGLVRGKIEARARLEVLPQGEVTGDVRAPKLVVHEGATISGQLKMTSGDNSGTN
jgi:cytoskeletal protein CcmA (bactofilin family)